MAMIRAIMTNSITITATTGPVALLPLPFPLLFPVCGVPPAEISSACKAQLLNNV